MIFMVLVLMNYNIPGLIIHDEETGLFVDGDWALSFCWPVISGIIYSLYPLGDFKYYLQASQCELTCYDALRKVSQTILGVLSHFVYSWTLRSWIGGGNGGCLFWTHDGLRGMGVCKDKNRCCCHPHLQVTCTNTLKSWESLLSSLCLFVFIYFSCIFFNKYINLNENEIYFPVYLKYWIKILHIRG